MSETRRGVGRYAAEGAVIVVGILIALFADAVWDYGVDRTDEKVALRQLEAEFTANAAQLDTVLFEHRRGLLAVESLLATIRGLDSPPADSLRHWIRLLDQAWTFNPKLAALESVIQAGQLGLIRDDSLRVELVGWPGLVEDVREDEVFAAEYAYSRQAEVLSDALNWGDIYGPADGRDYRPIRIVGNDRVEGALAYRYSWYETILGEFELVEASLHRIRALLAENLE